MAAEDPNYPTPPTHFLLLAAAAAALLLTAGTTSSHATGVGIPQPPNSSEPRCWPEPPVLPITVHPGDVDRLQFALNLEFLECEFFLRGALGWGLDSVAPVLAHGGPLPINGRKANLGPETRAIIEEFGYQEVGHVRAIQMTVGWFPRPLLDLSHRSFATVMNMAFERELEPPFDPYANSLNYWIASYVIPYMGLNGYVGANPNINGFVTKRLLAGLLGVEAGQDAIIRKHLYDRAFEVVHPYNYTVAEFTKKISTLRNNLAACGIKDEGIFVPLSLGAENRTESNVLSADANSLSYPRLPSEILRVVYGTGDEHRPGGFYPCGGNGRIARQYLQGYYQVGSPCHGEGGTPYEGSTPAGSPPHEESVPHGGSLP